ncbi:hypothetical protein BST27_15135 [Mycobacterium intermedium]|uniref:PPE family protein n=1 Tax=Mycobacterium intermedium TaxID=28445 RepID=A0A1E3SF57_MYCIE|nr:PPE domain-containing protein [Mycobacterium intermedium]MCV6963139.1 PPE domain-containing protein [Mycobacterium intermedium]ODR00725.1 hypothetical protein BHQ20_12130 [Mycobacterium intermedium]OPE52344.1 hypothetical protein BV508_03115 [Mycobacterium intermedium]ORB03672.1 hypothetical protein BST27_15135 [Mycobacterium intermedium]
MDFASLPPEVNSARIYAGPGAGPMLVAAEAWEALAAELQTTASAYEATIAGLTAGPWLGPASMSMAAAAAPFGAWLWATAAQAEQTATQAGAAAAAYEAAFAATVPPPVVAANRALLLALVATNIFGQNTPAIAATESEYAEMWAQDAATMLGYAGEAAAATSLTPFSEPAAIADPAGALGQAASVTGAAGVSAGQAQGAVSNAAEALSAVPNALSSLASPAAGLSPLDALGILDFLVGVGGVGVDAPLAGLALPYDVAAFYNGLHTDELVSGWAAVVPWPGIGPAPVAPFPPLGSAVSAGVGEAASVGRLSVPTGWTVAAPEMRLLATALPAANVAAAAEGSAAEAGSLLGQMALAGMAGRAMAGPIGGGAASRVRSGERVKGGTSKPSGEPAQPVQVPPGGPITSIAAELRELASLRDSGILTEDEFVQQKQRLLAF